METLTRVGGVVVCVFLSVGITLAQVTSGTISGTVKDSTGAVLPGVEMVLMNEDTGISRTVQTDAAGHYSAPSLGLGNYRVTATLTGFQTEVRKGIVLTVGREAVVDLALSVGAVTSTVEVTGEAPLVESTTSTLGSLVDDRTIRALPLNGRSYDQLALLQPGVTVTTPGSQQLFQYGLGKHFSVGGQRANTNSFLLDGTDINDQGNNTPGGAAGLNLGMDTIREFKILTNSSKAEYGRSAGSVITAVTRSGTNQFHGTGFEYLRNSALDARNFFDVGSSPPPFKRNQFGGVFGGPIKKDKTFFFAGYEGLRQGLGSTLIATVPNLPARQGILPTGVIPVNPAVIPFLNLYPAPNGRDFGDGTAEFFSSPTTVTPDDYWMVRVDHQLNEKTSIFGRYSFDNDSVTAPTNIPSFENLSTSRRQYVTLQGNSILNPKALNNFHFAYNRTFQASSNPATVSLGPELSFIPGQPMGPIVIGGGATAAGQTTLAAIGSSSPRTFGLNLFEWGDDFTYVTGKHSLKFGAKIERIRDNTNYSNYGYGQYSFASLSNFLTGTPFTLVAVAPGESAYRGYRQTMAGIYGQDDINVNSRLTLNLGLRWEAITDPTEVNGLVSYWPSPSAPQFALGRRYFSIAKKNFEPRLGIAWRLNDSGKTVLRAGGGIFHNQVLPGDYSGPEASLPPYYSTPSASNPSFPNGYQALTAAGGGVPQLRVVAPVIQTPVNNQYNVSLEQQLLKDTVVEVAYVGSKANHLFTGAEANTPIPVILPDGRKFFPAGAPRQNPNFGSSAWYSTDTSALYNGLTITVRRKLATGFQYQVFYTFSKAMDNVSGTAGTQSARSPSTPLDPTNPRRDWGPADFSAKNNVGFNFTYSLPFRFSSKVLGTALGGWFIDGIGTFTSGQPFTVRLSSNNSRDGDRTTPDRPNLNPGANDDPVLGGPNRYYDPTVFSLPLAGTFGNLGRNTIVGPGLMNVDLAIEKSFRVRESSNVVFRAEVFNIMNHANFDLPNYLALTATGVPNGSAGRVTDTVTSSRQVQFGIRINF